MKIEFVNMPNGASKLNFVLRYYFNRMRTWYVFHFKFPWVKYNGFVRVMKQTSFAHMDINIGNNVQFGEYCNIASNVTFGNNILMAGRVCFVGKNDHEFDVPGRLIWNGSRGVEDHCMVEDDVWIGHGSTIVGGITISQGSIIAAGSVVTKNIPACEIWGGVPAKKIRDRFKSSVEKDVHMSFLGSLKTELKA